MSKLITQEQLFEMAKILNGLPILSTIKGSPSDNLGLGYGDILLSVNGHSTPNADAFVTARNLRSDGMVLIVFRNGQELTFEMNFNSKIN